ncbi:MAG: SPASM domain-containing protein [Acidobacteria bacterium]|nr:SPASM domain-containing protein [Acidobacteriota bacterium]
MKRTIKKITAAADALIRRRLTIECDTLPYRFQDIKAKKLLNWLQVEASTRLRPLAPWGFPTHLQIEPTNTCNLRCKLCPVSGEMHRPSGFMDTSLYRRLLDEIGEYVFLVLFWDWGEPFMHPSAFDMIALAHEKGIRVASSTNGHLFADPRRADEAIRCGLDTLIFAVDGITQETYEQYRHRGDLQKTLQGIRTIVERRKELKSATPLVNFRFIVMRHNEHEVEMLPSFARELGVDVLTLKTLNPSSDNTYGDRANAIEKKESPFLPQNPLYRRFVYNERGEPVRLKRNACRNLHNAATVHWNGTVCPCTYDYDERFVMGNLNNSPFREIWRGPAYRALRGKMRRNDPKNYFCYQCSYSFKGGSCIDETVRLPVFFNSSEAS